MLQINYYNRFILFLLFLLFNSSQSQYLGSIQTNVPWRAGHASGFIYPYVIVYGGSQDSTANYSTTSLSGSTELWVWDSRNGSWYNPKVQVQNGIEMLPQIYIRATNLPSQGQLLTWVSNTTTTNVLQKLDINSWTWSFPTTNFQAAAAKVSGYSMTTVNNTVYTFGGLSVNNNGFPIINAVQNTLSFIDASSFQVSTGSNGLGLTDHTMCYIKKMNSLITFGGSTTGNPADVSDAINIYNLSTRTWNVQGLTTSITPGGRRLHTANCFDDFMIIFGGGSTQPFDSDVWVLNATAYPNLFWERKSISNAVDGPNPRMGHSTVLDNENKKLYIFGGWGVTATNDSNMYVLDVNNWSWTKVKTTGYPNLNPPSSTNTTTIPPSPTAGSDSHSKTGIIAGATVGGIALLVIAALALFFFLRKRKREETKDINSSSIQDEDEQFVVDTTSSTPKEYYYNHMNDTTGRPPYRMSKAWSSTSFARHSEIGDYSDKVVTGVLEAMSDDGTMAATHGSQRSESFRHSKVLLVSDGQVPNEITAQKPNEFSVAIRRDLHQHRLVDHHHASSSSQPTPGEGDDENWTFADSLSPIQYINNSSHQLSTATTSTQTWDTTEARRRQQIPLTHHHPSSVISMPVIAQTVTQPPATPPPTSIDTKPSTQQVDMYRRMSPLDVLASLGQSHDPNSTNNNSSSSNSSSSGSLHESFTILKQSTKGVTPPSTSSSISDHHHSHPKFLMPILLMLPKRYQFDSSIRPIVGPSNVILFVNNMETNQPLAIKLFGRREAWERECRTLVKLKSPFMVDLLEVLTMQANEDVDQEDDVKYAIVMERLDETLVSFMRKTDVQPRAVVRDVLQALAWCHNRGIAFCDLKPSNVMHRFGKEWKLIDFEASRTIGEECVGVITPRYCAPEVAKATTYGLEGASGVVATASVDLWSLGCLLYELETKRALFPNNIKDETILHFISHPSPSTPILNNGLRWNEERELDIPQLDRIIPNQHTRHVIKTLLSRDPLQRGSAQQWLQDPYFN
ncbi:hypothetical protein RMATCC62417_06202 [Rhizopus microsporus]|nr:hypothetical protein RMATCC62417_06202 [Rhizopus microsporus]